MPQWTRCVDPPGAWQRVQAAVAPADAVANVRAAHADVDASVNAPRSEQQAPSVQWAIRVAEAPDG